jgi:nucleotide-binding universal stress UspA family protein
VNDGPVIIGFDGSDIAERAIRTAAAVLRPHAVLVVAVHEAGIVFQGYAGVDIQAVPSDLQAAAEVDEALFEGARLGAGRGAEIAREHGLAAEPLVAAAEGSVGGTLVRIARQRDASVIVVGAHRYGRMERLFLGSTSREVLEHAPCPVLVVRAEGD